MTNPKFKIGDLIQHTSTKRYGLITGIMKYDYVKNRWSILSDNFHDEGPYDQYIVEQYYEKVSLKDVPEKIKEAYVKWKLDKL
jgi:hypothetical protein